MGWRSISVSRDDEYTHYCPECGDTFWELPPNSICNARWMVRDGRQVGHPAGIEVVPNQFSNRR